jgi:uncharacterized protein YbjT (DUF2867 family)/nitrite reductase/ring-hydroxylating ferredoxin subunit
MAEAERVIMKVVVIGGSGLIGSKLVKNLREQGHESVAASPNSGVDTLTGEGLAEALSGASVVVDVSNSPSFEDAAVLKFFETSTRNLLAAEANAKVGHHVALSVVGTDRLLASGYFRGKMAQENLIKASPIPYSIVRATQFFEFVTGIAAAATDGATVRVPPVFIQPMAADDVASALGRTAVGAPVNGTIEIGGPERFRLDEFIRRGLGARKDPREIVADPHARYFGAELSEGTLVAGEDARLAETRFEDWLRQPAGQSPTPPPKATTAAAVSKGRAALKDTEFRVSDLPPGSALLVGEVAVFNVAGSFYATQEKCTHRQGPLSQGKLEGSTVTCPLHGAQFNVCTGAVLRGPARDPLQTYRVIVEGEVGRVEPARVDAKLKPTSQRVSP